VSDQIKELLNKAPGWVREMGITIVTATPDEVTCEWQVEQKHHQVAGESGFRQASETRVPGNLHPAMMCPCPIRPTC
jgi:acyl-coenzyme A thioesterase PaaI-like protein